MSGEQDIIKLLKYVDMSDPDSAAVALSKNFEEIEAKVGQIGGILKSVSGGSVADFATVAQGWGTPSARAQAAALIAAVITGEAADGVIKATFDATEPAADMVYGDYWIDTDLVTPPDSSCVFRYEDEGGGSTGTLSWVASPISAVGKVFLDAYNTAVDAPTQLVAYYQATMPNNANIGDYWIDTDANNELYRAAIVGATSIGTGQWEPALERPKVLSAATFIVADGSTSNNTGNADYVVPEGSESAQITIQKAIDALPNAGGKVLLLEGTYIIDAPIYLPNNVAIEGQGKNTIIKLKPTLLPFFDFDRRSAYWYADEDDQEPTYYKNREPRWVQCRLGNGIGISKGTINQLTENQSSVETDTSGFVATASGTTLSRDTNEHWHGLACLKVVTSGSVNKQGFYVTCNPRYVNQNWAGSIRLKGSGNVTMRINDVTHGVVVSKNITLTSSWTYHELRLPSFSTQSDDLRLEVYTNGAQAITFYADALMLATTKDDIYCPPWTPNSLERTTETITLPLRGFFDSNAWAFEFTFTPLLSSVVAGKALSVMNLGGSNNYFYIGYDASDRLYAAFNNGNNGTRYVITDTVPLTMGQPVTVVFTGNGTTMRLIKNGVQVGTDISYVYYSIGTSYSITFGGSKVNESADTPLMVVEDFRFSRALRTVEESLAHYNSNDYHVVDADTVIIEPFNGTMRQFMGMVTNKDQYEGNDGLSVMSLNFMGIPSGYYGKTNGIFMQDASSSDVAYCSATGFAQAGIRLEHCSNSKVMNCDCKDIVGDAISLCAATHCLVSGNIVDGASTGIDVTYDHTVEPSVQSDNVVVSGNICKGCDVGIKVSSGLYCSVNGNTCIENKTGMELDGNFCSFSNNICKLNLQEGVFLDGEDCDFVGNLIIANSQNGDLDYPGIEMNISDRNNVQHNVVRYDATKRHTYGIIIDGDSNVVTNNDLLNSGGMGAIIDNGTSTKTTAGNRTA